MRRTTQFGAILGLLALAISARAQVPGTFNLTGSMSTARQDHTTTLLTNGQALVAGGAFTGVIQNVSLMAEIQPGSGGNFAFSVTANGFDLSANSNPISVELHVGSYIVKTTIVAQIVG